MGESLDAESIDFIQCLAWWKYRCIFVRLKTKTKTKTKTKMKMKIEDEDEKNKESNEDDLLVLLRLS